MITVEEILEYLNSDRVEDMTEEMHECSMRQSQAAIKQAMELNTKYHTPEVCDENENDFFGILYDHNVLHERLCRDNPKYKLRSGCRN